MWRSHCPFPLVWHKQSSRFMVLFAGNAREWQRNKGSCPFMAWLCLVSWGWKCGCWSLQLQSRGVPGGDMASQTLWPVPGAAWGSGKCCMTALHRSLVPAGALSLSCSQRQVHRVVVLGRCFLTTLEWAEAQTCLYPPSQPNKNHQNLLQTSLCLANICLCLSLSSHPATVQLQTHSPSLNSHIQIAWAALKPQPNAKSGFISWPH